MTRLSPLLKWAAFAVAAVSIGWATTGQAQVAGVTVSACGSSSNTAGSAQYLQLTPTGNLCTNASGGGGGSSATTPTTQNPSQVSVGSTATSLITASANTAYAIVIQTGTTPVYLGGSGVTASTGLYLAGTAGSVANLPFQGALYGITASGSDTVSVQVLSCSGGCGGGTPVPATGAFNQVSVTSSATSIVSALATRQYLILVNSSTTPAYCGATSGVTSSTGQYLAGVVGASITLQYQGAEFCITASGTATVSYASLAN